MEAGSVAVSGLSVEKVTQSNSLIFLEADGLYCKWHLIASQNHPYWNIYIVTNESYADLIKEQLPELAEEQILLEPARRNTAPCIAYAAYHIKACNPEANIVVAPSAIWS